MDIQAATGVIYRERDTDLPTLSGSAPSEVGKIDSVAEFWVGGKFHSVPVDPATGKYSWTSKDPIPDGDYSVSITIRDRAGNLGTPILLTLRIDTSAPSAPDLINMYDDQGLDVGSFDAGQTTDDRRPTLTGIAQAGTTVYLKDQNGNTIGSTTADKVTGKWVMEPSKDLPDGVNNLTLVAQETFAGKVRTGTASAPFTIIIGDDAPVLPPNTITIREAFDDAGAFQGKLASGALTDDTTPTLSGDVSAGSSVIVYYRQAGSSTWAGSATASVSGNKWTWTPGSALPYGEYEFQASAGAFSSALFKLDIASAADIISKTRIESAYDDFGTWQGPLSSGAITDDATPTFSGRGEANSKVVVRYTQPGQLPNTVVIDVDSSGKWSWTPASGLPAGNWTFETQPQGSNSWSAPFSLSIIGSGSFDPIITSAFDDVGTPVTLANGDHTDDTTPTLYGRSEANSTVYLRAANSLGSTIFSVTADSAGNWSWTPSSALSYGNWDFQASKSASGGWSNKFELVLEAPIALEPVIINFEDNIGTPFRGNGGHDETPTVHGTGKPGTTIFVEYGLRNLKYGYPDAGSVTSWKSAGTAIVQPDGKWQLTSPSLGNAIGSYDYRAKATDGSANSVWTPESHYSYWRLTNSSGGSTSKRLMEAGAVNKFDFDYATEAFTFTRNSSDKGIMRMYSSSGKLLQEYDIASHGIAPGQTAWTYIQSYEKIAYFTLSNSTKFHMFNIKYGTQFPGESYRAVAGVQSTFDVMTDEESSSINGDQDQSVKIVTKSTGEAETEHSKTYLLNGEEQVIDLTQHNGMLSTYNIFDITGSGHNTLKLDAESVLERGDKDLFIVNGKTQVMVNGDAGDVVQLADFIAEGVAAGEWEQQSGTLVIAGVEYQVFSNGDAELLVQVGVTVELPTKADSESKDESLDVSLGDVLQHAEDEVFPTSDSKQMQVQSHEENVVQMKDILPEGSDFSEWHQEGTVTAGGVAHQIYKESDVETLLQQEAKIELI